MRKYKVFIIDKFTRWPLSYYEVEAKTKRDAKRKIFKSVCQEDASYILTAYRIRY